MRLLVQVHVQWQHLVQHTMQHTAHGITFIENSIIEMTSDISIKLLLPPSQFSCFDPKLIISS